LLFCCVLPFLLPFSIWRHASLESFRSLASLSCWRRF
jgi:hypothetical protein